jgi:hypothetical protein
MRNDGRSDRDGFFDEPSIFARIHFDRRLGIRIGLAIETIGSNAFPNRDGQY